MPLMPARAEKSSALPSITGMLARTPMSPRPSTAVPVGYDGDRVANVGVLAEVLGIGLDALAD